MDITIHVPESDVADHSTRPAHGVDAAASVKTSSQWHGPPTQSTAAAPRSVGDRRVVMNPRRY